MRLSSAGVVSTTADDSRLGAALALANGNRKARLLSEAQVLQTIAEARTSGRGFAVRHGGEANDGTQRTTLCLAVKVGDWLTVGIGLSAASGAGPGRVWKDLQPWSRTDDARNLPRLLNWAKQRGADRVRVKVDAKAPKAPLPEAAPELETKLLAAVLAAPGADAPRMVFADLCSERSDPRGEFITLQLALARARDPEKERRAAELEKQHARTWNGALSQFTLKQRFQRGFVEEVELRAQSFSAHAERLFALAPISSVRLRGADLPALRKVAQVPSLARLSKLSIDRNVKDAGAMALAASPHLRNLKEFSCGGCGFSTDGLAAVLQAMPSLQVLHLRVLADGAAELISRHPRLRATVNKMPRTPAARRLFEAGRVTIVKAARR